MKINTVCFPCGVQPQYLIISFIVCSDCTDLQAVCASHGEHRDKKGAGYGIPQATDEHIRTERNGILGVLFAKGSTQQVWLQSIRINKEKW